MFYIFHGDDQHSKREQLAELQAKAGDADMLSLNTTRLHWPVSLPDLRLACDAVPFLSKVRLVIVEGLFAAKPEKAYLDELIEYIPRTPETTRLVFLEPVKLRGNHPVLKLATDSEAGYVRLFERPEGGQLDRWIRQRVVQKEGRISGQAAQALAINVGNDLHTLDNEIEKLVMYRRSCTDEPENAEGNGEITVSDIQRLSPYAAEANIFDLVDALGNRDGRKAAALLQKKLREGTDPFYLFAMFVRQFRLLIQVKELAEEGDAPPTISRKLQLHTFVVGKLFQQCRHFRMEQLEQVYRHLLEVDVEVKLGQNEMTTALGLLVAGLTVEG